MLGLWGVPSPYNAWNYAEEGSGKRGKVVPEGTQLEGSGKEKAEHHADKRQKMDNGPDGATCAPPTGASGMQGAALRFPTRPPAGACAPLTGASGAP
eukprot:8290860-Alexandrium_andersonii.AAC.1